MMWTITGWIAAGCVSILIVAFTIAILINLARPKPRTETRRII